MELEYNIQQAEQVLKTYKGKKRKIYAYAILRTIVRRQKIRKIFGI